MNAIELDAVFKQNNWAVGGLSESNHYELPEIIRYALVASLGNLNDLEQQDTPRWISSVANRKINADYHAKHRFDPVKRNKSISQLLKDYQTKGKRIEARVELKQRMPYASFAEQKKVLCTFLDSVSADRLFALRYLDKYWDDYYTPYVEKAWRLFREKESAKVITHHFSIDFIEANQTTLISDYHYSQVRLRLPVSAPIDRERLTSSEYLYLCARLMLHVSDDEADRLFFQTLLDDIAKFPFIHDNICDIHEIGSMVWSLGMLGKTDILLRFTLFHQAITSLVAGEQWEDVKKAFLRLGKPLDFTNYEECLRERECKKQFMDLSVEEPF